METVLLHLLLELRIYIEQTLRTVSNVCKAKPSFPIQQKHVYKLAPHLICMYACYCLLDLPLGCAKVNALQTSECGSPLSPIVLLEKSHFLPLPPLPCFHFRPLHLISSDPLHICRQTGSRAGQGRCKHLAILPGRPTISWEDRRERAQYDPGVVLT